MFLPVRPRIVMLAVSIAAGLGACSFDRTDRWLKGADPPPPQCTLGKARCSGSQLQRCITAIGGPIWETEDDCGSRGQVSNPDGFLCTLCLPDTGSCDGLDAYKCDATGQQKLLQVTCDPAKLEGCRDGKCLNLCSEARRNRSNVGCEYWPVDLDNA